MLVNADFSQKVVVRPDSRNWVASPGAGVQRCMLDRIGNEIARATSIVRFGPNSKFPAHLHGGGEEIFVIDGVFSDEFGDFPAGSYLRNPAGTAHSPFTRDGCTLFVKLHQFASDDFDQFCIDTTTARFEAGTTDGVSVLPLHTHGAESCSLIRWAPGARSAEYTRWGGEEILVLDGALQDDGTTFPTGTWIRSPHLSRHRPSSEQGCLIYLKTGHLAPEMLTYNLQQTA